MAQKLSTIVADFSTSLATKIAIGGTSCTLQSATDKDGVSLPTGQYLLTIDGESSDKEYWLCTVTGTSVSVIQNVTRQGTLTSGSIRAHRIGASVKITNYGHLKFINDLLDGTTGFPATTKIGYDGDPSLTSGDTYKWSTVDYVNGVAIAGGADASTTVKGISKLSSAPASATNPIAVGDNDTRVPTQDENNALVGTSGTPSTSNKFVTADDVAEETASKVVRAKSNGKIGDSLIGLTTAGDIVYGNGTDATRLAIGTANQVLAVNAGATAPEWVTPNNAPLFDDYTRLNLISFVPHMSAATTGTGTRSTTRGAILSDCQAVHDGGACTARVYTSQDLNPVLDFTLNMRLKVSNGTGANNYQFAGITGDSSTTDTHAGTSDRVGVEGLTGAWYFVTCDGSTVQSTDISGLVTETSYNTYKIVNVSGSISLYINGSTSASATHSTNVPIHTTSEFAVRAYSGSTVAGAGPRVDFWSDVTYIQSHS